MTLLQNKAVNCQLLILLAAFMLAAPSASLANTSSSIIPRAKTPTLNRPARPLAKPSTPLKKPKSRTRSIIGFCNRALSAVIPSLAKNAKPAPVEAAGQTAPATTEVVVAVSEAAAILPPLTFEKVTELADQADSARKAFEASSQSEELKTAFAAKAQDYFAALKTYLDSKSIAYKEAKTQDQLPDGTTIQWPTLVLSVEGEHRLNRFAAGMERRYKVNLAADLLLLRREGNVAARLNSGDLVLSEEALKTERATVDEIEEILHVRFAAEREERNKTVGHVPVQMYFTSDSPVRPQTAEHDYMFEMTFEDIWAQSVKISVATALINNKPTPEDIASIQGMVEYLAGMTETAEIAVERAKLSSLEGNAAYLNRRRTEGAYLVFGYEKEFNFATFIPEMALDNAGDFAIREMNDAVKLTKFMREYFYEPEGEKPTPEEIFAKAANFKSALYDFIAVIGRSKPTADATYDMVAWIESVGEDLATSAEAPN